jgi:hypothetical protein
MTLMVQINSFVITLQTAAADKDWYQRSEMACLVYPWSSSHCACI